MARFSFAQNLKIITTSCKRTRSTTWTIGTMATCTTKNLSRVHIRPPPGCLNQDQVRWRTSRLKPGPTLSRFAPRVQSPPSMSTNSSARVGAKKLSVPTIFLCALLVASLKPCSSMSPPSGPAASPRLECPRTPRDAATWPLTQNCSQPRGEPELLLAPGTEPHMRPDVWLV